MRAHVQCAMPTASRRTASSGSPPLLQTTRTRRGTHTGSVAWTCPSMGSSTPLSTRRGPQQSLPRTHWPRRRTPLRGRSPRPSTRWPRHVPRTPQRATRRRPRSAHHPRVLLCLLCIVLCASCLAHVLMTQQSKASTGVYSKTGLRAEEAEEQTLSWCCSYMCIPCRPLTCPSPGLKRSQVSAAQQTRRSARGSRGEPRPLLSCLC